MKRIYIAIIFIFIALLTGCFESGFITAKSDMFIDRIRQSDKLMQNNRFSDALELCKKNEQDWYDSTRITDMLLIHDYVDSIGIKISKMTTLAKLGNVDMYFSESTAAKKELASIKESEYPLIENLL